MRGMKMKSNQTSLFLLVALAMSGLLACTDVEAPLFIDTQISADSHDGLGPYGITTVVSDNWSVKSVRLYYRYGLEAAEHRLELAPGAAQDSWGGSFAGPQREVKIYYYLEAYDHADNVGRDPALAPDTYSFAIIPDDLWQPEPDAGFVDAGAEDADAEDASEDGGYEDGGRADAAALDAPSADQDPQDVGAADSVMLDALSEDAGP